MDKFEYKVKAEEIKELIAQGDYEQAAEIADSIDWRRVKSVMMLCIVSDVYKMCRRYEESRDMLLLAYDRHPGGRTIVYSLCELSIKMEDYVQAVEYYKEFVEIAPKDTGKYILQYKLYEAQDVSLEERIAVLEELKKREYREKWAYELAYLYHRVGLATKCVEECDELVLWFGDGKYVTKALELKKLHAPLTAEQQYKYEQRFQEENKEAETASEENTRKEEGSQSEKTADAASEPQKADGEVAREAKKLTEEPEIQVKTFDAEQYESINLQEELAAGIQEYFGSSTEDAITRSIVAPMMHTDTIDLSAGRDQVGGDTIDLGSAMKSWKEKSQAQKTEHVQQDDSRSEVFFGETGEIAGMEQQTLALDGMNVEEKPVDSSEQGIVRNDAEAEEDAEKLPEYTVAQDAAAVAEMSLEERWMQQVQPPKHMANVLAMEGDGQMSFVLPEREPVERQITGQISLNDIILEWERLKKENEEKRKEEVRQRVLQQTGAMFTEFEASVRDGLLEKLESGQDTDDAAAEDTADMNTEDLGEVEELTEITDAEEDVIPEVTLTEIGDEEPNEAEAAAEEAEEESEEQVAVEEEAEAVKEVAVEAETPETEEVIAETEIPAEEEVIAEAETPAAEEVIAEAETPAAEEVIAEAETPAAEEVIAEAEMPAAEDSEAVIMEEEAPIEEELQEEIQEAPVRTQSAPEKRKVRNFTKEERELYGPYIQGRSSKEQLIQAIDGISMAAYTGNVIVTGDEGMDSIGLAKNIVREIQMTDSNFSGKIAKISGDTLNDRDVKKIIGDLCNGALIIQKATLMNREKADSLYKALQQEHTGIVVVLEDNKRQMDRFLESNAKLLHCFTSRVDIEALSDDALVSFGKKYAREKEYSIDTMGLLALHTRIAEMQTSDHAVTVMDVKEIMDEAIESANSKTIGHFFDVLFGRRYDDDDMIILKEKDFV